jgi:hypothetical protein
VPPSADAVVFLDPAELLACLARDFLLGAVAGTWWWQAWLQASGRSTLELVLDAWIREARHIPAAMAALDSHGLAARFAGALSPREARTLFVAMVDAYELPSLGAPTPSAQTPMVTPLGAQPVADRGSRALRRSRAGVSREETEAPDGPPWEPIGLGRRPLTSVWSSGRSPASHWRSGAAPLAVRARTFQSALHTWRRAQTMSAGDRARAERGVIPVESPADDTTILAKAITSIE